jgi:hypothetical protein
VAAFMDAHERPQDPRYKGDLAATTKRFHASRFDYYGKRRSADGLLLGKRPARAWTRMPGGAIGAVGSRVPGLLDEPEESIDEMWYLINSTLLT